MQASDIPSKLPVPFANSAGAGYVRAIPVPAQTGGAASFTTGFPPENFLPISGGGIPPWGEDVNGILKMITQWTRWLNAGGMVQYDATFSTSIDGYPQGAFLLSADQSHFWLSTADNNTSNPDTGGAGWTAMYITAAAAAPLFDGTAAVGTSNKYAREDHVHPNDYCGVSTGTANAQIISTPNGLTSLADGTTLSFTVGITNTNATTLQVGTGGGALGPLPIVKDGLAGPVALAGGELVAGNVARVEVRSGNFHLQARALGTASSQDATGNTGKVASLSGPGTTGNIPVFNNSAGDLVDSGVSPASLAGSAESVLFRLGDIF